LAGRVIVSFVIAPSGEVQSALLGLSTIGYGRLQRCIVEAVRRWTFPAPSGGGVVGVNYPFVLMPSESLPPEEPAASPAEEAPPGEQGLAAARRCMANGDNACVIRALEGRAQSEQEIALLIEAHRARGQTQEALRYMRIYVERFPGSPRARNYQQILSRHGG
jgi:TonB family protein